MVFSSISLEKKNKKKQTKILAMYACRGMYLCNAHFNLRLEHKVQHVFDPVGLRGLVAIAGNFGFILR
jgi:hypothetical protein